MRPSLPNTCRLLALLLAWAAAWQPACTHSGPETATRPGRPPLSRPVKVGRIGARAVTESSGIVGSRSHAGVYWTMNDSGDSARIFALRADGKLIREVPVQGARNVDWEDIAADGRGNLFVGDFGNNAKKRNDLTIYRFAEPKPQGKRRPAVRAKTRFRYPAGDGPFDCEALFIRKGWAYLITKERWQAKLYRVRLEASGPKPAEAEPLGRLPGAYMVTGADLSPDGRHLAVLGYGIVWVYDLPKPLERLQPTTAPATRPDGTRSGEAKWTFPRPRTTRGSLGQSEAICWVLEEPVETLLITNEDGDLFRVGPQKNP